MPKFVFEITEEEWQRLADVAHIEDVGEDDDASALPRNYGQRSARAWST